MLKRIKYCVFFLLISVVQVLGQDLYKLKVSIDTLIVTSNEIQTSECQTANFKAFHYEPAFRAIELDDISLTNDNPMPSLPPSLKPEKKNEKEESKKPNKENEKIESNKPDKNNKKGKSKIEVRLKGDFNYLFYWNDEYIYSFIYEDVDTLQSIENLSLVHSDTLFRDYQSYLHTRELCGCGSRKEGRNQTILLIDSLKEVNDALVQADPKQFDAGIYWLWSSYVGRDQPLFVIIGRDGRILVIEPVKYWIHFNAFKASSFKKAAYGQGLKYDAEDDFYDRSPLSKYLYSNYFYLIAEGEGNKGLIQSSKWKMLVDYNAFGNFRCMLPNTIVPSKNIFTTPKIEGYDYEEVSKVFPYIDPNDSLNSISALSTSLGFVSFQLIEKVACTGIYRIHAPGAKISSSANSYDETELEQGTVNNLKYLPGIYFLPGYFKVKTINGISKEEFIKNQCKN